MFRFKQFTVSQSRCAMKVGTDGVLLGAWADVGGAARILDVGTGTGVIALMLAQRTNGAKITAIDVDPESIAQARENFERSPWKSRLDAVCGSIQTYKSEDLCDLIASNPPYFTESLKSPDAGRNRVRHTDNLSFEELVEAVVRLLKPTGKFALILPTMEMARFGSVGLGRLFPTRITEVRTGENRAPKRVLMEFSPTPHPLPEPTQLLIGSEEYIALTRDFYLNF